MNAPALNTCRTWIFALLAIGLVPFAAGAGIDPFRAAEREIRSAEDQLAIALSKADIDALTRLTDENQQVDVRVQGEWAVGGWRLFAPHISEVNLDLDGSLIV